MWCEK
jgi:hypothetical protein